MHIEKFLKIKRNWKESELGGQNINSLRFADDAALTADPQKKLQELLNIRQIKNARKKV